MRDMSNLQPYLRPVTMGVLAGALLSSVWTLFLDAMLMASILPTLALLGSIIMLALLFWVSIKVAVATWLLWRQAKKHAWRWSAAGTIALVVMSYIAVMFIFDQGPGAGFRAMHAFDRLPEGNLMATAGPHAWTFVGIILLTVVILLWRKIAAYPSKVKAAWNGLPKRVMPEKQPKRANTGHDHSSSDDFRRQLGLDFDDEEDDPDATHDIGAQLHLSR